LNAITLYSVAAQQNFTFDIHVYQNEFSTLQGVVLSFMLLTVAIWCLSAIRLALAGLLYWPLLVCHIRGNLKEYCCHKVDKRISQLLADRRRKRFEKPKNAVVAGDVPDLKGDLPTLPKVELVGDGESVLSMPLYALSRTESTDSSRYLLSRTNTQVTDRSALSRKDSDSRPLLLRSDTQESNGAGARRQPTLPHLVGDFSIPEIPKPPMSAKMTPSTPKIDTRVPLRQSPPSVTSASARSMTTPLSARTDPGPAIPGNPPLQGFTRRPSEPMQARRPSHFREDLGPQRQNSGPRTAPGDPYQTPFPPRQNGFQEQQSQVRGGYVQQQAPPVTNPYGQTPRRPERPYPANGNGGAAGARRYNAGYPRFDGGYQST
jgi:Fungal potassium channel